MKHARATRYALPALPLLVALLIAVGIAAPAPAGATVLEVQRFDRPLGRSFVISSQGEPMGVIERPRWRQLWRRNYEMCDRQGQPTARAQQSFGVTGLRWPWWLKMHLSDASGQLGTLEGTMWTLLSASWVLRDAHGTAVAQLHLDDHAQALLISSTDGDNRLLGQAVRVQQASGGRDSWALVVDDASRESLVPVWPLILAFVADTYDELVRRPVAL